MVAVVVIRPFLGKDAHLCQVIEQVGIEDVLPEQAVEAFDVGVLGGLSRLDEQIADAVLSAPVAEGMGGELRTVVGTDDLGHSPMVDDALQRLYDAVTAQREPHFNGKRLTVVVIDEVQCPEPPSIGQRIAHHVHAPALVDASGNVQFFAYPLQRPSLVSPSSCKLHLSINSQYSFSVPSKPLAVYATVVAVEPTGGMCLCQFGQLPLHLQVVQPAAVVPHAAVQRYHTAGTLDGGRTLIDQILRTLPALRGA